MLERLLVDALHSLGPKQQRVARFMAANEAVVAFTSATELAQRLDVDPATVVRLARALGFKGYPDLQRQLRARFPHHYPSVVSTLDRPADSAPGPVQRAYAQALDNVRQGLEQVEQEQIDPVLDALHGARRVVVFGGGVASGLVVFLASSLQTVGVAAEADVSDGLALVQRLALLDERDLVVGAGFYRYTRQTTTALERAGALGIPRVVITDSPLSPLAAQADRLLVVPVESASHRVSLVAPLALADALIAAYAARFPEEVTASLRRLDAQYRAAGLLIFD